MKLLRWWWCRFFGEWRVLYTETQNWSRPMSYQAAREYATIFKGEVRMASEFRPREF